MVPGAQTATLVTERGTNYLDGGIVAIPSMIGTESATVRYSGAEAAFRRVEGTLDAFGARYLGAARRAVPRGRTRPRDAAQAVPAVGLAVDRGEFDEEVVPAFCRPPRLPFRP